MSYENKIMQLKQRLGKKKEQPKEEKIQFQKPERPAYVENWQKEGLTIVENDFGLLFKREVKYPHTYQHGDYQLSSFFDAIEMWQNTNPTHPYAVDFEEPILFFDTETTGLKGVGTNIFLVGILEAKDEYFQLTQYVLADPANEAAFLFETKFWQNSSTIFSYNGKSFDWPQLQTRWTLNQQYLPKLKQQRQIDLLHSTKRIWKNNLDRMKLTKVEEEKLGFTREGDIPGFLAPIIYTDAVKSGNAQSLMKVLDHNEWDLLSLVSLYVHSTTLLLEGKLEESATTYTNIGKWFGDIKQVDYSHEVLSTVVENYHEQETGLANYYLGLQQKRNRQYELAINSFQKALSNLEIKEKVKVLEQLAILFEHQKKDYESARYYTVEGLASIEKNIHLKKDQREKQQYNWLHRLNRIEKKLLMTK